MGRCAWRAGCFWLATEVTAGLSPLPLPIKNPLSLLPRRDAGIESRSLRSIRSHPFDPYLRDVRASPSGGCRFGQARMTQASTMLEIRIERIERIERIASVLGEGAVRVGSGVFLVGNGSNGRDSSFHACRCQPKSGCSIRARSRRDCCDSIAVHWVDACSARLAVRGQAKGPTTIRPRRSSRSVRGPRSGDRVRGCPATGPRPPVGPSRLGRPRRVSGRRSGGCGPG